MRLVRPFIVVAVIMAALMPFGGSSLRIEAQAVFPILVTSADNENDGVCNGARCSLLEAINQANASTGVKETIRFGLPALTTIQPEEGLPPITDPVIIDGRPDPDFAGAPTPGFLLDGADALEFPSNGLTIEAGNSEIRGLIIGNFNSHGIFIDGSGGNIIQGNFLGIDATGMEKQGNAIDGVQILFSSNNTIGGTTPDKRNVISGNLRSVLFGANRPRETKSKAITLAPTRTVRARSMEMANVHWVTSSRGYRSSWTMPTTSEVQCVRRPEALAPVHATSYRAMAMCSRGRLRESFSRVGMITRSKVISSARMSWGSLSWATSLESDSHLELITA